MNLKLLRTLMGHSVVSLESESLLTLGGRDDNGGLMTDIWLLSSDTVSWSKIGHLKRVSRILLNNKI